MYDCFYFYFKPTPCNFFCPKLDVCSCLGETSYFSCHGLLLFDVNLRLGREIVPAGQQGTELLASVIAPLAALSPQCLHLQGFHHFSTCTFFLTPGISVCADTHPRSDPHEAILLRQAFCALLNDGCFREMVIMIDSEPQVADILPVRGFTTFKPKLLIRKRRCIHSLWGRHTDGEAQVGESTRSRDGWPRERASAPQGQASGPDCEPVMLLRDT